MITDWERKGCVECRQLWLEGKEPRKLGVDDERHAFLHRCDECGTYWEQFERYVDVISKQNAENIYGEDVVDTS